MLKYILRKNCSAVAFLLLMILTLGQNSALTCLSGRSLIIYWPHGLSPWSKREIWPNLKASKKGQNLWNQRGPTQQKVFHAFQINLYLHKLFEPILYNLHAVQKMAIWRKTKRSKIFKTAIWETTKLGTPYGPHDYLNRGS